MKRTLGSFSRVITSCLSSNLILLLHLEALLPPLHVTLTHQSLSYFERTPKTTSIFPLASLAHHNPRTRLKKGSWRSFSSFHNLNTNPQLSRETLILCPPKRPWSSPSLILSLTLAHSDITAWTDGAVPGRLGERGAGIHLKSTKYLMLPLSLSQLDLAPPAIVLRLSHSSCFERCISHFSWCNFESITLFSDSQSVLTTLSAPLPYLIPKSLTHSLLNSLSNYNVNLQ